MTPVPTPTPPGKYLVLFFYPLDFTFVCPTELVAFSDRAGAFRQLQCELLAVSVDSHFSHLAWYGLVGVGVLPPFQGDLILAGREDWGDSGRL